MSWAQYGPAERGVPLSVPWSFCSEPWLFNAGAKARLLKVEAELRMSQSIAQARAFARMGGAAPPSLEETVLLPAQANIYPGPNPNPNPNSGLN